MVKDGPMLIHKALNHSHKHIIKIDQALQADLNQDLNHTELHHKRLILGTVQEHLMIDSKLKINYTEHHLLKGKLLNHKLEEVKEAPLKLLWQN